MIDDEIHYLNASFAILAFSILAIVASCDRISVEKPAGYDVEWFRMQHQRIASQSVAASIARQEFDEFYTHTSPGWASYDELEFSKLQEQFKMAERRCIRLVEEYNLHAATADKEFFQRYGLPHFQDERQCK